MKGKTYLTGLLLSFQFFTTLPIRMALPMDEIHLRAALRMFPLFGFIKGCLYGGTFWLLIEYSPLTPLGNAFLLWLLPIIWTGGLHLDGWIDTSDAFFSYRDREKRLDILQDPRVGAFGVLSLIVLLAARFVFSYELIQYGSSELAIIVLMIPVYSQMLTGLWLNGVPPAKQSGIAYYFQQGKDPRLLVRYLLWLVGISLFVCFVSGHWWMFILLTFIIGCFYLYVRSQMMKHFGGITGDLLGAGLEGTEALLWMILWLSVSIGMG